MNKDIRDNYELLEHKIHVLEEENAQLAERAEDSLLLGLISESIQAASDEFLVFEYAIERISILKTIPFVSCGYIEQGELKPISVYCSFSDGKDLGYPIKISPDVVGELEYGPVVVDIDDNLQCNFNNSSFQPKSAGLIGFSTQKHNNGIFLFIDDSTEGDRLTSIMILLSQVVNITVAKFDNLVLLEKLAQANKELESRVKKRTQDLTRSNIMLEKEIADRRASEKALWESHQTFLTVMNSIDATIYVADLDTYQILFMNKFMIDSFGKDYTGKTCYESFRQEDQPCSICTNKQLLNNDRKPAGVVVWQGINPVTGRDYINYDRAIKWIDGRLVRLQIATDITSIKKMEMQLQQSQKFEAIGTLAGGIAHDFNNLLMGIQGRASLMQMDLESQHPCLEHVIAIMECTRSATNLTKQLLGVARGGKYEVRPVDINDLVLHTSTMFGRTKKEIRIHTKFHDPPPVANADQTQIEQVLLNLYVNAWQAMPEGGELYLETSIVALGKIQCKPHNLEPGRYIKISVTDTGIGMDEDTLQRAFDPFFTTKEKERGTGLGLASAYGIIKNHSGIITVDSQPGQGTTFIIYLPTSDQKADSASQVKTEIDQGTETILLVDDERIIIEVAKPILERLGYKVIVAETGEQAISFIQRHSVKIDLVILDMIMPGMDGGKTFDRIHGIQPKMPVLLSSGYSLNNKANEIMQRGCNGFIQKPFNVYELSRKLRKLLDDRGAQHPNLANK